MVRTFFFIEENHELYAVIICGKVGNRPLLEHLNA